MISDALSQTLRRRNRLYYGLAGRFVARPIAVAAHSQTLYQRLMSASP
jgi:hypothetical protein